MRNIHCIFLFIFLLWILNKDALRSIAENSKIIENYKKQKEIINKLENQIMIEKLQLELKELQLKNTNLK